MVSTTISIFLVTRYFYIIAPNILPTKTFASPQPSLITLWWQADRAPEQDGRGWLLRLHGPAIPVQDWLALLGAPGSGKTSGTLALDAELPMPGPASAWRVRWRHDGPSPLPVRAFPAFL